MHCCIEEAQMHILDGKVFSLRYGIQIVGDFSNLDGDLVVFYYHFANDPRAYRLQQRTNN